MTDQYPGLKEIDFARSIKLATSYTQKAELTAKWILHELDAYYSEYVRIPDLAKTAFENRDHKTSIELSKRRLSVYSLSIYALGPRLKHVFPEIAQDENFWRDVEAHYLPLIKGRYSADLAFAYIHSVLRIVCRGEWTPVAYSFEESAETKPDYTCYIYRSFPIDNEISSDTIAAILELPHFSVSYHDARNDALLVAERVNQFLAHYVENYDGVIAKRIEMIDAGFYRNRGAYLVGRIVMSDESNIPFIIALLNHEQGIYVDAVMNTENDAHNIFSSTLANFHVTNAYYHELAEFLHSIMPTRPLGLHYSTIGFNHVGKVAVMNELREELTVSGEVFQTSVGFRGTVAIGFCSPGSAYNLKVIRDHPTEQYKWGEFVGLDSVLAKYRRVHEINRTGSMLDNIIYYNLKLDNSWFEPALLEEILQHASQSVSLQGDDVVFKSLIVQRRMTPLPVFLETANEADARTAVVNLGYCIKNNAAANIFNKDLDGRNYGVSHYLKVYLYDYDALERLTDVKIRTNLDRIEGEEDIPDWYFEDGVVFLPEEIETGLRIPSRALRSLFREVHGDLLTTQYWERIQDDLRQGNVPSVRIYPESRRLECSVN